MRGKIPKWESKLWSYISNGDGEHCPLYDHCLERQDGKWCAGENIKNLIQLIDSGSCFDYSDFEFVKYRGNIPNEGLFKLLEKLAEKQLKQLEASCPPVPTEIVSQIDARSSVEVRPVLLKAYHGATWHPKGEWVIHINKQDTPVVRRFTLFHEVFHILAHYGISPLLQRKRGVRGSFFEVLADHFAIYMLMPEERVKEKWAAVNDLDLMAKIFEVPRPAMWFRIKTLGLLQ